MERLKLADVRKLIFTPQNSTSECVDSNDDLFKVSEVAGFSDWSANNCYLCFAKKNSPDCNIINIPCINQSALDSQLLKYLKATVNANLTNVVVDHSGANNAKTCLAATDSFTNLADDVVCHRIGLQYGSLFALARCKTCKFILF